ncbi:MAG: prepilin-type N-terminal cleavage/methylation domain-containing protein [Parvularculaceae bacterium]|nr:prepilin-type N-terminal cleavage/methylation domain-containing protein [Parvularculaceae bacterium]
MSNAGERGLTLVELLVVLVIMGLASSLVLLNAPPSRSVVERDALKFASSVKIVLDEMLFTGAAFRLVIDTTGYSYEQYVSGEWVADGVERAFQRVEFDRGVTAAVEINDAALANARALGEGAQEKVDENEPKIIRLDPIGPPATFSVRFISVQGSYVATLSADSAISVKSDA